MAESAFGRLLLAELQRDPADRLIAADRAGVRRHPGHGGPAITGLARRPAAFECSKVSSPLPYPVFICLVVDVSGLYRGTFF